MKNLVILMAFVLVSNYSKAQNNFVYQKPLSKYFAKISLANCKDGLCSGNANIKIFDQESHKEIQSFVSADLDFALTENQDPKNDTVTLSKDQSPVIFGDFNFDGLEDIAIRNGSNELYSAPSYDVYLLKNNQSFTFSKDLTRLASNNLGMFTIDKKNKLLTVDQKDGSYYHKTISYKFDTKKGLIEVSSTIEDASIGDNVVVIKQKIVDGKMQKTIQKFKTTDYYVQ
jgi:hypothetical protein